MTLGMASRKFNQSTRALAIASLFCAFALIGASAALTGCGESQAPQQLVRTTFHISLDTLPPQADLDSVIVRVQQAGGLDTVLKFTQRPGNDTLEFALEFQRGGDVSLSFDIWANGMRVASAEGNYQAGSYDPGADSLQSTYVTEVLDSLNRIVSSAATSSSGGSTGGTSSSGGSVVASSSSAPAGPPYLLAFEEPLIRMREGDTLLKIAINSATGATLSAECDVQLERWVVGTTGDTLDYAVPVATLRFRVGDVNGTVRNLAIEIPRDSLVEGKEIFKFRLVESCPLVGLGGDSEVTLEVTDRDSARVALDIPEPRVLESADSFRVVAHLQMEAGLSLQDSLPVQLSGVTLPARSALKSGSTLSSQFASGAANGDSLVWWFSVADDATEAEDDTVSLALALPELRSGNVSSTQEGLTQKIVLLNDDFAYLFVSDTLGQRVLVLLTDGTPVDTLELGWAPFRMDRVDENHILIAGKGASTILDLTTNTTGWAGYSPYVSAIQRGGTSYYAYEGSTHLINYFPKPGGVPPIYLGSLWSTGGVSGSLGSLLLDQRGSHADYSILWFGLADGVYPEAYYWLESNAGVVDSVASIVPDMGVYPLGMRLDRDGGSMFVTAMGPEISGGTPRVSGELMRLSRDGTEKHGGSGNTQLWGLDLDDAGDIWAVAVDIYSTPSLSRLDSASHSLKQSIPLSALNDAASGSRYFDVVWCFSHNRLAP